MQPFLRLALAGAVLLPCSMAAQPPAPAGARQALLATERRASDASARDGVAAALGAVAHERLALLYEAAPVVAGRAGALALLEAQPQLRAARVQWLTEHAEISRDSTVGVTWGVLTYGPASGGAHRFGRYLAGWRREEGQWRLTALAWMGATRPDSTVVPAGLAMGAPADGIPARAEGPADADRAFAARGRAAGAPTAFGEFAAMHGVAFAGGEITVGPRAIRESFAAGPSGTSEWAWGPVMADVAASGDLGWTIGEATITPRGGTRANRTKYLSLWRQEGGEWRYVADGGNSRP